MQRRTTSRLHECRIANTISASLSSNYKTNGSKVPFEDLLLEHSQVKKSRLSYFFEYIEIITFFLIYSRGRKNSTHD